MASGFMEPPSLGRQGGAARLGLGRVRPATLTSAGVFQKCCERPSRGNSSHLGHQNGEGAKIPAELSAQLVLAGLVLVGDLAGFQTTAKKRNAPRSYASAKYGCYRICHR